MKIPSVLVFFLFLFPSIAFGQDSGPAGLVTCSGTDCNFCLFVELFDVIVDWIVTISILLIVMVLAYAGFGLVTSAGNQSAYENAKTYFVNAMIGLILLVAAWTIVDTIMKALTGSDYGVWEPVECGEIYRPEPVESDRNGIDFNNTRATLEDLGFNFEEGPVGQLNQTTQCLFVILTNSFDCQPAVEACIRGRLDADISENNQVTCIREGAVGRPNQVPITCLAGGGIDAVADCSGAVETCRFMRGVWTPPTGNSTIGGFCTTDPGGGTDEDPIQSQGCSGGTCVPLNVPCSNSNSCSIAPDLVGRFNAFHSDIVSAGVIGSRVTEAMPPSRVHKSQCHMNGTCVDYSKAGGMNAQEVLTVINAARANGLRPVYEVVTSGQRDQLVAGGVNPADIKVLGDWISAPHFSIYGS